MNELFDKTRQTLKHLLRTCDLSQSKWCIAFNGGKDSTVVLYLMLEVCHELQISPFECIYYKQADEFEEVEAFVKEIVEEFNLPLKEYECGYKESMVDLSNRGIEYILMGQRKGDPKTNELKMIDKVDYVDINAEVYRVNLILDWSYNDVWKYLDETLTFSYLVEGILKQEKRVCCLYNQGYTSLGNKLNTIPNKHLFIPSICKYKAAKELLEPEKYERAGRS